MTQTDTTLTSQPITTPDGSRCTDVLSDTLRGYAGIHQADFDLENGHLNLVYDPHILSDENALRVVRKAGEQAYSRAMQCALKSEQACAKCTAAMEAQLFEHYRRLAQAPAGAQAQLTNGRIEIQLPTAGAPAGELAQAEAIPVSAPVVSPEPRGIPRHKLEVIFTATTLVAAILAFAGQRFGLVSASVVAILYAVAFVAGGYYGLLDGISVLRERRLDVNLLMVLAALGAAIIGQPAEGATLLFLFSLSNTLQTYAMGRSRKAIEKLLDLRPQTATVRRGSRLVSLPVEKLLLGDTVVVRPGERFPIDGEVLHGSSAVDQSTITGESIPVEKARGDGVFAGTMNGNGALEVRVTHLAQDTTLAKIVRLVEEARTSKAQTQRMLDDFEQVYALLVLGGALLLVAIPWLLLGNDFYPTFYRAMTWLVVASPCALVISTPASILSAIANGARHGILFKGGAHLERAAMLKVIAFDKTGTLTTGDPVVTAILPQPGVSQAELLRLAAAAESRSEHPLARAITRAGVKSQDGEMRDGGEPATATDFQAIPGLGVEANVDGRMIWIGSQRLFDERRVRIPGSLLERVQKLEDDGQTVMLVYAVKERIDGGGGNGAWDGGAGYSGAGADIYRKVEAAPGEWLGLIAVADTLRPDAAQIVARLKARGIERVVMLTGDNERVAAAIAARAGVDEFHAGLLPQDKVRILKILRQKHGPTAMVGDGVNDAPALAAADVGIAMGGAGTDVALETADVVLMADDLAQLPYVIGLAKHARRIVFQNLAFALAVIVLLVAAAFGAQLPLPLGVVGHEGSTVIVVLNGLRLLRFRL